MAATPKRQPLVSIENRVPHSGENVSNRQHAWPQLGTDGLSVLQTPSSAKRERPTTDHHSTHTQKPQKLPRKLDSAFGVVGKETAASQSESTRDTKKGLEAYLQWINETEAPVCKKRRRSTAHHKPHRTKREHIFCEDANRSALSRAATDLAPVHRSSRQKKIDEAASRVRSLAEELSAEASLLSTKITRHLLQTESRLKAFDSDGKDTRHQSDLDKSDPHKQLAQERQTWVSLLAAQHKVKTRLCKSKHKAAPQKASVKQEIGEETAALARMSLHWTQISRFHHLKE